MSYLYIAISLWPMIIPHIARCGTQHRHPNAGFPADRTLLLRSPDVHGVVLLGVFCGKVRGDIGYR
jgi:hypothetical protein